MKRSALAFVLGFSAVGVVGGCEAFSDRTPRNIGLEMRGDAGKRVRLIYSTEFVAGLNEAGITRVQVFGADTVVHALPFDTLIDISAEQRWFAQAESVGAGDTLAVTVIVDVDDRNLVNEFGGIFPDVPWRFAYSFNHRFTRSLDVQF